jgi:hypothetical protein
MIESSPYFEFPHDIKRYLRVFPLMLQKTQPSEDFDSDLHESDSKRAKTRKGPWNALPVSSLRDGDICNAIYQQKRRLRWAHRRLEVALFVG